MERANANRSYSLPLAVHSFIKSAIKHPSKKESFCLKSLCKTSAVRTRMRIQIQYQRQVSSSFRRIARSFTVPAFPMPPFAQGSRKDHQPHPVLLFSCFWRRPTSGNFSLLRSLFPFQKEGAILQIVDTIMDDQPKKPIDTSKKRRLGFRLSLRNQLCARGCETGCSLIWALYSMHVYHEGLAVCLGNKTFLFNVTNLHFTCSPRSNERISLATASWPPRSSPASAAIAAAAHLLKLLVAVCQIA